MSTQSATLCHELIVVTGASTGIGAATARELARRGFHVLAGVRRDTDADALRASNLEPIMLDPHARQHSRPQSQGASAQSNTDDVSAVLHSLR